MESVIAEKYAVALLQVAQEQKTVDAIGDEIQSVQKLVEDNADLKATLEHPRVKTVEKLEVLRGFLTGKLSATMENFLMLLIMKKRIKHLKAVADHYERLLYQMKGKAIARVLTSLPLAADQKKNLAEKLSQMFGVAVELKEEVKPDLIGGMMIYLGDQRMDGSVLGQLERMKQRLLKVEIE
ncbi:MAG TPA: ATP synthase F1 subunit delta [bacterium]|jgi:F-type H+-transporting ATPase subunit delta|nr:ATP synthase F1 subunit delta [bacterium]